LKSCATKNGSGSMKICLCCDRPLHPGPEEVLRIRIGAVRYDEDHDGDVVVEFITEEEKDEFQDGDKVKWLCPQCSAEHNVNLLELRDDACMVDDGIDVCGQSFEPITELASTSVLRVERGVLVRGRGKGPLVSFEWSGDNEDAGNVCFWCAVEKWSLPLWQLVSADDLPPDSLVA